MLSRLLNKHCTWAVSPFVRVCLFFNLSPAFLLLVTLILAGGTSAFLALQNWGLGLLFFGFVLFIRSSLQHFSGQSPFFHYSRRVSGVYTEFLVFAGLAVSFPFPAFLAFSLVSIAEYARTRVLLIVKKQRPAVHSFGSRADRLALIIITLLIVYVFPLATGFFFAMSATPPTPVIEAGLYTVSLIALVSFTRTFFAEKHRIAQAIQNNAVQEYCR